MTRDPSKTIPCWKCARTKPVIAPAISNYSAKQFDDISFEKFLQLIDSFMQLPITRAIMNLFYIEKPGDRSLIDRPDR